VLERRAVAQSPCTVRRTCCLGGEAQADPTPSQFPESGSAPLPLLPLLPEEATDATANPFIQTLQHTGCFAETEVATPTSQIPCQRADHLVNADPVCALGQFPEPILEAGQCLRGQFKNPCEGLLTFSTSC
jgi:hypothetical protein